MIANSESGVSAAEYWVIRDGKTGPYIISLSAMSWSTKRSDAHRFGSNEDAFYRLRQLHMHWYRNYAGPLVVMRVTPKRAHPLAFTTEQLNQQLADTTEVAAMYALLIVQLQDELKEAQAFVELVMRTGRRQCERWERHLEVFRKEFMDVARYHDAPNWWRDES